MVWSKRNSGRLDAALAAAVRTAVRTKHPLTVENDGEWWSVVVKWDRRTFQLAVLKRVSRSVTVYDGYRPVYNYGSEGCRFESCRARQKPWSQPYRFTCVSKVANKSLELGLKAQHVVLKRI